MSNNSCYKLSTRIQTYVWCLWRPYVSKCQAMVSDVWTNSAKSQKSLRCLSVETNAPCNKFQRIGLRYLLQQALQQRGYASHLEFKTLVCECRWTFSQQLAVHWRGHVWSVLKDSTRNLMLVTWKSVVFASSCRGQVQTWMRGSELHSTKRREFILSQGRNSLVPIYGQTRAFPSSAIEIWRVESHLPASKSLNLRTNPYGP